MSKWIKIVLGTLVVILVLLFAINLFLIATGPRM